MESSANKPSNLDSITRSYLKGELTFQEYESLIEDHHIQSGFMAVSTNLNQYDSSACGSNQMSTGPLCFSNEVEILNQSLQSDYNMSSSCSDLSVLTPLVFSGSGGKRKERKRTSSNNSILYKQTGENPTTSQKSR